MIRGCQRAAALAASFGFFGSPLAGQTAGAALDLGASIVEYDGFLVSGAAVVSPTLRFDTPTLSFGAQGSWTIFESGNQVFQGNVAGAWFVTPTGFMRLELGGALGTSRYAKQPATGHALARARLHLLGERTGGWVSGATGSTLGGAERVPVELAVGGWTVTNRLAAAGNLATTWIDGDGFLDVVGGVRWSSAQLQVDARGILRPWTNTKDLVGEPRTGVFGEVAALIALNQRIAIELSGGTYPSDPSRRVLAARYVTMGLRVDFAAATGELVSDPAGLLARVARARARANTAGPARLEVAAAGQPRVLRVYVENATSVELMGDFTDWRVVPLTRRRSGVWEARIPLPPGAHRVNVRVDRGAWLVPAGTRPEQDDFGGRVGLLMVP